MPMVVLGGRRLLLPMLDDFDVELPFGSQYVLSVWSPAILALPSLIVLLAMFTVASGRMRRRFMWIAAIFGVLVSMICGLSILIPLWSLWRALG